MVGFHEKPCGFSRRVADLLLSGLSCLIGHGFQTSTRAYV